MTKSEKVELAIVPFLGTILWPIAPLLPDRMSIGELLVVGSALLLFQSLVRDIWLLVKKRTVVQPEQNKEVRCMCAESTVGVIGVMVGLILFTAGIPLTVNMNRWTWSLLVMVTMIAGFVIKDYVVEWNPWRIRREKDHLNIVFTWKT